ncbi:MAG: hypothetical protein O3B82_01635 [Bacteroidetes bacterium]|nr:hypothetical protein [Bacteroidota bacterium]
MSLFAQHTPKKIKASMKSGGSISASYHAGSESAFLNFGGPGLRLDYGKFGISYHMFPSLRYFHGDITDQTNPYRVKTEITPMLGTGLQLHYKKLAIVLPMYYFPINNVWIVSAGLGYKL